MSDERKPASALVPLDAICVLIEAAQSRGIYGGTRELAAFLALPDEVHNRLTERANARTERILAQHEKCKGHKHSVTLGATKCLFCGRFIPDAEVVANAPSERSS